MRPFNIKTLFGIRFFGQIVKNLSQLKIEFRK